MIVYISDEFTGLVDKEMVYSSVGLSPYAQLIVDNVNVYCADSKVIDYVCPPSLRRYQDPKCVKRMKERIKEFFEKFPEYIRRYESLEEAVDAIFKLISECAIYWGIEVARSCYVNLSSVKAKEMEEKFGIQIRAGPSIFIAVDRVNECAKNISKKLGIPQERAFRAVFDISTIHETFHAYTDLNEKKYTNQIWHVLIEESLATYTTYLNIEKNQTPTFLADMETMPFEYIAWEYWRTFTPTKTVNSIINYCWAKDTLKPLIIPSCPIIWSKRIIYRQGYIYEVLHEIFAMSGPEYHRIFHDYIVPILRSKKPITIIWKLLALHILKYMLRI